MASNLRANYIMILECEIHLVLWKNLYLYLSWIWCWATPKDKLFIALVLLGLPTTSACFCMIRLVGDLWNEWNTMKRYESRYRITSHRRASLTLWANESVTSSAASWLLRGWSNALLSRSDFLWAPVLLVWELPQHMLSALQSQRGIWACSSNSEQGSDARMVSFHDLSA